MLNLYIVKIWHSSGPRHFETIAIRTSTARRAEHLASESFPGCMAAAERNFDVTEYHPPHEHVVRAAQAR